MERNYQNLTWPGWENAGELGHGNFGSVYKIQRTTRGRTEYAALKVIRIPKEESEIAKLRQDDYDDESITQYYADCLNKIEDEYAMMAELKGYANIVYCDDFFSQPHEDGFGWYIYIKMELLTPLKAYLPAEIPEEQVISLGIDICNALTRCEELKIVHRDIKPENIFVSKEGKYKLGDFGIARTMEGTTGGTKTGTFDYMAPEVNNSKAYHTEVDIYSLGLVMYWMLNERTGPFLPLGGKKPTPSMKQAAWDRRFRGEQIPVPKNGSEELKAIILKACAYDPKKRYQSAKDMRFALEALKAGTAAVTELMPVAEPIPAEDVIVAETLTVGPGWDNNVEEPVAENIMTVGPSWHDIPATEDNDVTIGPVFAQKETTHTQTDPADKPKETQPKYKKPDVRWGRLGIAVVLIVTIAIACVIGLGGKHAPGWAESEGERFYYDGNGEMLQACVANIGDNTYYFNAEGVMQTGWRKLNGATYYFDQYGRAVKECLADIGTNTYYFNAEGVMQTGWKKLNGSKYYFDNTGCAVKECLAKITGNTYYFNAEGIMQRGWKKLNGEKYYFNDDGVMQTGWQLIDRKVYYCDNDGYLKNGSWKLEGKNCTFDESGCLISFNGMKLAGWWEFGGNKYYFDDDGMMATGSWIIDQKKYVFGEYGQLLS